MKENWNLKKIKRVKTYLDLHDALYFFIRDQMEWEDKVGVWEITSKPNKARAIEEYLWHVVQGDVLKSEGITLNVYKTDKGLKFKKIHHINLSKNG